jgi:hypothetical protein
MGALMSRHLYRRQTHTRWETLNNGPLGYGYGGGGGGGGGGGVGGGGGPVIATADELNT